MSKKNLIRKKKKQKMGNRAIIIIMLLFLFSCKRNKSLNKLFIPDTSFLVNDVKVFEKLKEDVLIYQNKIGDTTVLYQFCKYYKQICYQSWTISFEEKDSLKIIKLLEKKNIGLANDYGWLNKVKFNTELKLESINRNIQYDCIFEKNKEICTMTLSHKIVLYDKNIDWESNFHPTFYDKIYSKN